MSKMTQKLVIFLVVITHLVLFADSYGLSDEDPNTLGITIMNYSNYEVVSFSGESGFIDIQGMFAYKGESWKCEVVPIDGETGVAGENEMEYDSVHISKIRPFISIDVPPTVQLGEDTSIHIEVYNPDRKMWKITLFDNYSRVIRNLYQSTSGTNYFSTDTTINISKPWDKSLTIGIFYETGLREFKKVELELAGDLSDQRLNDFHVWIQQKGYSEPIINTYMRHAEHYMVRGMLERYFDIREGIWTKEILQNFKHGGPIDITFHDIIDPNGENETLEDSFVILETYLSELYGKSFNFEYQLNEVNFSEQFGPIVQYSEDSDFAIYDRGAFIRYLRDFVSGRYGFDIFHRAVYRVTCDDDIERVLMRHTGSYPTFSNVNLISNSKLSLYAHEYGHDMGLQHHFPPINTFSHMNNFFGLSCIAVATYISVPQDGSDHLLCPICRYALEPDSEYNDDDQYPAVYNALLQDSWMLDNDFRPYINFFWISPRYNIAPGDDLTANVAEPFDRDGSETELTYRWYKNDVLQPGITGNTVDSSLTYNHDLSNLEISVNSLPVERNIFRYTCNDVPIVSGENLITATITDPSTGAENSYSITIIGNSTVQDDPPVLHLIGNKHAVADDLLELTIQATDPDGDLLTYEVNMLPEGAHFDPDTQTFSWIPRPDQAGEHEVTFTVSEYYGTHTDSETIVIFVINLPEFVLVDPQVIVYNTNRLPELKPIEDKVVYVKQKLIFDVEAEDPDGDSLTYTAKGLPKGAVFRDQKFKWCPRHYQAGVYYVRFIVCDNYGTYDSELVKISVQLYLPHRN